MAAGLTWEELQKYKTPGGMYQSGTGEAGEAQMQMGQDSYLDKEGGYMYIPLTRGVYADSNSGDSGGGPLRYENTGEYLRRKWSPEMKHAQDWQGTTEDYFDAQGNLKNTGTISHMGNNPYVDAAIMAAVVASAGFGGAALLGAYGGAGAAGAGAGLAGAEAAGAGAAGAGAGATGAAGGLSGWYGSLPAWQQGAVVGAGKGGLQAGLSGGNILEGAVKGGVTGAVGGLAGGGITGKLAQMGAGKVMAGLGGSGGTQAPGGGLSAAGGRPGGGMSGYMPNPNALAYRLPTTATWYDQGKDMQAMYGPAREEENRRRLVEGIVDA